jgi:hypothetical protein
MNPPKLLRIFTIFLFILLIIVFISYRTGYFHDIRKNEVVDTSHWVNKLKYYKTEDPNAPDIPDLLIIPDSLDYLMSGSKSMPVIPTK